MGKKKKNVSFSLDDIQNHFNELFFWFKDAGESSVIYSENLLAVTGFSSNELTERGGWFSLILQEDLASYRKAIDRWLLDSEADILKINYRIKRKDGRIVHLSEKIKLIRSEDGELISEIGLISDVSDYIELIDSLRSENERLEAMSSSKDSFLAVTFP